MPEVMPSMRTACHAPPAVAIEPCLWLPVIPFHTLHPLHGFDQPTLPASSRRRNVTDRGALKMSTPPLRTLQCVDRKSGYYVPPALAVGNNRGVSLEAVVEP